MSDHRPGNPEGTCGLKQYKDVELVRIMRGTLVAIDLCLDDLAKYRRKAESVLGELASRIAPDAKAVMRDGDAEKCRAPGCGRASYIRGVCCACYHYARNKPKSALGASFRSLAVARAIGALDAFNNLDPSLELAKLGPGRFVDSKPSCFLEPTTPDAEFVHAGIQ